MKTPFFWIFQGCMYWGGTEGVEGSLCPDFRHSCDLSESSWRVYVTQQVARIVRTLPEDHFAGGVDSKPGGRGDRGQDHGLSVFLLVPHSMCLGCRWQE